MNEVKEIKYGEYIDRLMQEHRGMLHQLFLPGNPLRYKLRDYLTEEEVRQLKVNGHIISEELLKIATDEEINLGNTCCAINMTRDAFVRIEYILNEVQNRILWEQSNPGKDWKDIDKLEFDEDKEE